MKRAIVLLVFIAAAAAGGYYYYTEYYLPSQTAAAATDTPLQTATVRRGDIVISAQGAGSLVPAAEVELGFDSGGTLTALTVAVGELRTTVDALDRVLGRFQDPRAALLGPSKAQLGPGE